jgi:hypothetical protein
MTEDTPIVGWADAREDVMALVKRLEAGGHITRRDIRTCA